MTLLAEEQTWRGNSSNILHTPQMTSGMEGRQGMDGGAVGIGRATLFIYSPTKLEVEA